MVAPAAGPWTQESPCDRTGTVCHRRAEAAKAQQQLLLDAEASIDTMSNTELQQVIDGIQSLKGLSPDEVRTNPVFRPVVASRLNWQQK